MAKSIGIVGAGLIGRLLAYQLILDGHAVHLFDRDDEAGTHSCAWVGAGMLAPYSELDSADELICSLGRESLKLWPSLIKGLAKPVFFQHSGTLVIAHQQDRAELSRFQRNLEYKLEDARGDGHLRTDFRLIQNIDSIAIDDLEPELSGRFHSALYLPDEGQVDNRQLLSALACTLKANGAQWNCCITVSHMAPYHIFIADNKITENSANNKITDNKTADNKITENSANNKIAENNANNKIADSQSATSSSHLDMQQLRLENNGVKAKKLQFDLVIDTRGLNAKVDLPKLRGVRGEIIRVRAQEVNIRRPIRVMHPRYPLYIVPRPENHYLIGATSIESEDESPITIQSALELLSAAFSVHSGFAEAAILEMNARCRPALIDNAPKIYVEPGLMRINGLYRHGFLISPKLVDLASALIRNNLKIDSQLEIDRTYLPLIVENIRLCSY